MSCYFICPEKPTPTISYTLHVQNKHHTSSPQLVLWLPSEARWRSEDPSPHFSITSRFIVARPSHKLSLLALTGLICPLVAGATCASAPPTPDDAVKLEEKQTLTRKERSHCETDGVPGDHSPLVVHWPDAQRAALESVTSRGVAVIKYTCEGVEVLPACTLPGMYAYGGVSKKTQLVKMESRLAAEANFGTGLPYLEGLEAAFAAGRSLDLAYMLVGHQTTTRTEATVAELEGRCDGATHFVYQLHLGAWAMGTSTQGEASTALGLLGRGGEASGGRSVEKLSSDGDPDRCSATSRSDRKPAEGCSALLRATLFALGHDADNAVDTRREGRRCIDGFVFADGQCKQDADTPACVPGAEDKVCEDACASGATTACAQFADRQNAILTSKQSEREDKQKSLDALQALTTQLTEACDSGEGSACTSMAYLRFRDLTGDAKERNQREGLEFATRGCVSGDPRACGMVQLAFTTDSGKLVGVDIAPEKYISTLELGCAQGAPLPCAHLAEIKLSAALTKQNIGAAMSLAERACIGKNPEGCLILGAYSSDRVVCENLIGSLEMRAYPKDKRDEAKTMATRDCKSATMEDEIAKPALEQACRLGVMVACN